MDSLNKPYRHQQIRDQILIDIESGTWGQSLPSERTLSQQYGVGRDQVHEAILLLRSEKIIELQGKRNIILRTQSNCTEASPQQIVILSSTPLEQANSLLLFVIDQLREKFLSKGVHVVVENSKLLQKESPSRSLKNLISAHGNSIWLLHGAAPAVQQWFVDQKLPSVVLGTGIDPIPYVDIDHKSAMVHALSTLTRSKNNLNRAVFIKPESDLIGLQKMAQGFIENAGNDAPRRVISYTNNPNSIIRCFEKLPWNQQSHPTAIIVSSSRVALKLASWLPSETGLKIGKDVALICIVDNHWLSQIYPSVAHYSMRSNRYTSPLTRLINKLLDNPNPPKKDQYLIIPDFVKGDSV